MQQERNSRLVRVNDFVADNLEAEADMMPPWTKFQAGIWRDVAKDLRASESTKMVRAWEEEPEPKSVAASVRNQRGPQQAADVAIVTLSDGLSLHRSSLDSHTEPNLFAQALRLFLTRLFWLFLRPTPHHKMGDPR
jgi:hypothetical protein